MKNLIRRNFFIEGDVITDKGGTPFMFLHSSEDGIHAIPLDRETLTYSAVSTKPVVIQRAKLKFHQDFNPGMTHISNR